MRDLESTAADAALAEHHVLRTTVSEHRSVTADAVRGHTDLQHMEDAFRTGKSMLQIQQIDHNHEKHVQGHLFLRMLVTA